ncbi:MAG: single-stranded DNA-binding protein [Clostridia bacterium]|jgi:single-strand DNA-binding protein|nr:single-stranded DNA-binding protein [Clostridia bacterium]
MNKVILIGNLTRDPEMRTTQSGVNMCTLGLAVQRRFANPQGVREADFFNVIAWRQLADLCGRYLQKGRKICVVGSIQNRTYDAQDGSKRYVTEIMADEIEFLSSPGDTNRPHGESVPAREDALSPEPVQNTSYQPSQMVEAEDDELPF